jgi:hypothetical protein
VVGQLPRRLDLGRHVDHLVPVHLKAADGTPEGLARLDVFHGALPDELGSGGRAQGHHQPLPLQVGHGVVEPVPLLPEKVARGHAHVLEDQLSRIARVPAQLLEPLALIEAGHPLLDDQRGEAAVAGRLVGLAQDQDEIRPAAVRDEHLGAVQDPVVAVLLGRGAGICKV